MVHDNKTTRSFLFVSMALFIISLTQKAYCTTSECSDAFMTFILGWAAVFTTAAGISWLANPLLFISWIMIRRKPRLAMMCSVISFLLAGSFLLFDSILANEAGHSQAITGYRMGFWFWLASHLAMLIGTFVLVYKMNLEQFKRRREAMNQHVPYEH